MVPLPVDPAGERRRVADVRFGEVSRRSGSDRCFSCLSGRFLGKKRAQMGMPSSACQARCTPRGNPTDRVYSANDRTDHLRRRRRAVRAPVKNRRIRHGGHGIHAGKHLLGQSSAWSRLRGPEESAAIDPLGAEHRPHAALRRSWRTRTCSKCSMRRGRTLRSSHHLCRRGSLTRSSIARWPPWCAASATR